MHAETLFPVFEADVRTAQWRPPGRPVVAAITSALSREQLPADTFGVLDPDAVSTAATASRQILGYMNETAHTCRYAAERAGGLDSVHVDELNHQLCTLLHNRDGYHTSLYLTPARREARGGWRFVVTPAPRPRAPPAGEWRRAPGAPPRRQQALDAMAQRRNRRRMSLLCQL